LRIVHIVNEGILFAYKSIAYIFCAQIKILETELLLPTLLLSTARFLTCIIAYSSQPFMRNEIHLTKNGLGLDFFLVGKIFLADTVYADTIHMTDFLII